MVLPSTRVSLMELCSQGDDELVLRNNEKIEWPAGGLLENLFYKLYDEAGRDVPLTADIASLIKVWYFLCGILLLVLNETQKHAAINKTSVSHVSEPFPAYC